MIVPIRAARIYGANKRKVDGVARPIAPDWEKIIAETQNGLTITRMTTPIISRVGSSLKMR